MVLNGKIPMEETQYDTNMEKGTTISISNLQNIVAQNLVRKLFK